MRILAVYYIGFAVTLGLSAICYLEFRALASRFAARRPYAIGRTLSYPVPIYEPLNPIVRIKWTISADSPSLSGRNR